MVEGWIKRRIERPGFRRRWSPFRSNGAVVAGALLDVATICVGKLAKKVASLARGLIMRQGVVGTMTA
jgi:hypothetical protein